MQRINRKPGKPPNHEPVIILETGEIFATYKEAADAIHGDGSNVRRVAHALQSHHKGYHIRFLSNN